MCLQKTKDDRVLRVEGVGKVIETHVNSVVHRVEDELDPEKGQLELESLRGTHQTVFDSDDRYWLLL